MHDLTRKSSISKFILFIHFINYALNPYFAINVSRGCGWDPNFWPYSLNIDTKLFIVSIFEGDVVFSNKKNKSTMLALIGNWSPGNFFGDPHPSMKGIGGFLSSSNIRVK